MPRIHIARDLSPRMRAIFKDGLSVSWTQSRLKTDFEAFTEAERKIANQIGTPGQFSKDESEE